MQNLLVVSEHGFGPPDKVLEAEIMEEKTPTALALVPPQAQPSPMQQSLAINNIFEYNGMQVRTTVINTKIWFVAKDLCTILEIKWQGNTALNGISAKNKGYGKFQTPGGMQDLLIVSEPGMYRLVMRSTKPEAEKFQDWVTEDVLPSIRKHGMYMTPETAEDILNNPDKLIR